VDDPDNIRAACDSCCKSCLVKPITQEKLFDELKKLKLIPA
jgi:AmiR/NasT family two-component response regulator